MHLCFNDVEHVSSIANQPVGYPDIHSGAKKPAGPLIYGLETHQKKRETDGVSENIENHQNNKKSYKIWDGTTWKVRLRGWKLHSMSSSWTKRAASMEFPYTNELGVTTLQPQWSGHTKNYSHRNRLKSFIKLLASIMSLAGRRRFL